MFNLRKILKVVKGARLSNTDRSTIDETAISGICTDTRSITTGALFVALIGEKFDGHDYLAEAVSAGAATLCVSARFADTSAIPAGVPVIIVPDTLKAYQELAGAWRWAIRGLRVVGVTGSCGKTSVKEITAGILSHFHSSDNVLSTESNTNNHVGVPLNLLRLTEQHKFAVIEMGSNHPGEIAVLAEIAAPDISIITSIASAHLEFFGDLQGVATEKSAILRSNSDSQTPPVAVIPEESPSNDILRATAGPLTYTFGTAESADLRVEYLGGDIAGSRIQLFSGAPSPRKLTREIKLPLRGRVQALNAAAASLAAIIAEYDQWDEPRTSRQRPSFAKLAENFDFAKLADALESCVISGMRMKVEKIDGVTWINDAYNANPDSVREAILWLAEFAEPRKSRIALGDMLELGPNAIEHHAKILELAVNHLSGAKILAIGELMTRAVASTPELSKQVSLFPDADSAKLALTAKLAPGDFVFLKGSRGMRMERLAPIT